MVYQIPGTKKNSAHKQNGEATINRHTRGTPAWGTTTGRRRSCRRSTSHCRGSHRKSVCGPHQKYPNEPFFNINVSIHLFIVTKINTKVSIVFCSNYLSNSYLAPNFTPNSILNQRIKKGCLSGSPLIFSKVYTPELFRYVSVKQQIYCFYTFC